MSNLGIWNSDPRVFFTFFVSESGSIPIAVERAMSAESEVTEKLAQHDLLEL